MRVFFIVTLIALLSFSCQLHSQQDHELKLADKYFTKFLLYGVRHDFTPRTISKERKFLLRAKMHIDNAEAHLTKFTKWDVSSFWYLKTQIYKSLYDNDLHSLWKKNMSHSVAERTVSTDYLQVSCRATLELIKLNYCEELNHAGTSVVNQPKELCSIYGSVYASLERQVAIQDSIGNHSSALNCAIICFEMSKELNRRDFIYPEEKSDRNFHSAGEKIEPDVLSAMRVVKNSRILHYYDTALVYCYEIEAINGTGFMKDEIFDVLLNQKKDTAAAKIYLNKVFHHYKTEKSNKSAEKTLCEYVKICLLTSDTLSADIAILENQKIKDNRCEPNAFMAIDYFSYALKDLEDLQTGKGFFSVIQNDEDTSVADPLVFVPATKRALALAGRVPIYCDVQTEMIYFKSLIHFWRAKEFKTNPTKYDASVNWKSEAQQALVGLDVLPSKGYGQEARELREAINTLMNEK